MEDWEGLGELGKIKENSVVFFVKVKLQTHQPNFKDNEVETAGIDLSRANGIKSI